MAHLSEDIKLEIKYKNDIETVMAPYVTLKRRGKNLVGLCPFHNEKTPSFTVYPENGSFYCFGCGVGGDVFTFISLAENLDYMEAVRLLADRAGVNLPEDGFDDSLAKLKSRILEANREAARFYYAYLCSAGGNWAKEYLNGRGLTDATIKHFGLGAAPDAWDGLIKHLRSKGFTESEMEAANLVSRSQRGGYYDRFRNRVMFPVIDLRGNVVAFSGRARPGDDAATAKYVNTSDTLVYKKSNHIYGLNFAKAHCAERVVLVEGNMDVVSLHQAGIENAVAALGTAFGETQSALLARYTKEIVLTLDADTAGQKAVKRALETLKNSNINARVLVLPDGKDPDEFIKKHGANRFKALLDGAVSDVEYKLAAAAEGLDLNTDDGKLKHLQRAAQVLAEIKDKITVDLYASRLSEKYSISKTALMSKIDEIRRINYRERKNKEISQVITPRYSRDDINPEKRTHLKEAKAEELIISALLVHPDSYEYTKSLITPERFVTPFGRRVALEIFALLEQRQNTIDISLLTDRFSPAEIGFLITLQNSSAAQSNYKQVIADCAKVLINGKENNDKNDDSLSTDEWAKKMQEIANKKRGQ